MNIQYCHNRVPELRLRYDTVTFNSPEVQADCVISPRGGTTIALEVIPDWFFDTLEVNNFFEKSVGIARCSDDDNYCKKTGRDLSTSRMKARRLVVKSIQGNADHKVVVLIDKDNNQYVLAKKAGCKVHFIEFDNG